MIDYIIRKAQPDDAEAVIGYMKQLADEPDNGILFNSSQEVDVYWPVEQERETLRDYAESADRIFLLAVHEGQIISIANAACGKRTAQSRTAGLGVSVRADWRERGVGTAIMHTLIEWARAQHQIRRLELEVFTHNARAIHVYEKLGFQREGVRRAAYFKDGRFVDALCMAILFDREM